MKPFVFALGATFLLCACAPRPTFAQTAPPETPRPVSGRTGRAIKVVVAREKPGAPPLVTLRASETSVAGVLSVLSVNTGAKIIINADAPLEDVDIERASVPDAVAKIVEMAKLRLTVEPRAKSLPLEERTYVVSKAEARSNPSPASIDMQFTDVSVKQIVEILARQFDIKAQVAPQVASKTLDIYMLRTTAMEALQTIADAADLEVSKTADGYVLQERAAK